MQNMAEDQKAVSSQVEAASAELARTAKEVQRMGRERDREEARAREAREGAEKGDRGVDLKLKMLRNQVHLGNLGLQGSKRGKEHAALVRYRHLARIHPRAWVEREGRVDRWGRCCEDRALV
jgi:hypothetical protein